ncbi:MAG: type II toxin-antitoxin system RelE/ParE family toxin [Bifidobacteriaceae bacterium]|jgi:toxin ParE1/3/4|nr:type II toxin-antitoxin system RelE/ParE family toxin [Bifidobacteriaceae bacterium]
MAAPVRFTVAAGADARSITDRYRDVASSDTAASFANALRRAVRGIRLFPSAGSPRYGALVGIPGLRHIHVKGFPYLVFYKETGDVVWVWRILHAASDIPTWLLGDK